MPPPLTRPGENTAPCVVFALAREAMFFRRRGSRPFPRAPFPAAFHARESWKALAVETGAGASAVESTLSWLLSGPLLNGAPYRPAFVLSAGFSGAIVPGLRVGDLVLASEVCGADGRSWAATWPDAASDAPRGRLLTAASVVGAPAEKRRLGEQSGAVAVDMETAAVARTCTEAGVPFGCLRVISDDVDTPLSESLLRVLAGGRVRAGSLAAAILKRPALIVELMRLGRHTRLAARRLAAGLERLLAVQ